MGIMCFPGVHSHEGWRRATVSLVRMPPAYEADKLHLGDSVHIMNRRQSYGIIALIGAVGSCSSIGAVSRDLLVWSSGGILHSSHLFAVIPLILPAMLLSLSSLLSSLSSSSSSSSSSSLSPSSYSASSPIISLLSSLS